jgi:AcrR family transcriptional regulator
MKSQPKVMKAAATPEPGEPKSARNRIFDTARELFYRQGIRGVGVEAIASEAGTTKMSLYRHFPSKDDLCAECLKADQKEFQEWWDSVVAPHAGNPRKQLEAIFKEFQGRACSNDDGERGCPLANAAVEITEESHPGYKVVQQHKADVRKRFQTLCREMGVKRPDKLGDALMLLMEGAYMTRLVFGAQGPVQVVWKAASALIEAEKQAS